MSDALNADLVRCICRPWCRCRSYYQGCPVCSAPDFGGSCPAKVATPDAERWQPERDVLAEKILLAWHTVEWYIGDATQEEWEMAYAAADAALNDGGEGGG